MKREWTLCTLPIILVLIVAIFGCGPESSSDPAANPPLAIPGEQTPQATSNAVAEIESLGGTAQVSEYLSENPIIQVSLMKSKVTDDDLEKLKGLTHLQTLCLGMTQIT